MQVKLHASSATKQDNIRKANMMVDRFGSPDLFHTMTYCEDWAASRQIKHYCDPSFLINAAGTVKSRDMPAEQVLLYFSVLSSMIRVIEDPVCGPFGKIVDSLTRTEQQQRGHNHAHQLLWRDKTTPVPMHCVVSTVPDISGLLEIPDDVPIDKAPPMRSIFRNFSMASTGDTQLDKALENFVRTCYHRCTNRCYISVSATGKRAASSCRYSIPLPVHPDTEPVAMTRMGKFPRSP